MSAKSKIEWTDATWSPIRARVRPDAVAIAEAMGYTSLLPILTRVGPGKVGPHCERVSKGCDRCYSETNNGRCLPANGTGLPFDRRSRDLVEIFLDQKIWAEPLSWRKPRRVFVCSQTDLFGEFVPDEMIYEVFKMAACTPRHQYQVLTKRAARLQAYSRSLAAGEPNEWPLPNVWLGVSCEDQAAADARIPHLLATPAAVRFVSLEPLLGPVDIRPWLKGQCPECHGFDDYCADVALCSTCHGLNSIGLDWVIIGGESGPGARPFDLDWLRAILAECAAAGVPAFVKQMGGCVIGDLAEFPITNRLRSARGSRRRGGAWSSSADPRIHGPVLVDPKGGDSAEWPEWARVRQMP